jgi:hypothetical protein
MILRAFSAILDALKRPARQESETRLDEILGRRENVRRLKKTREADKEITRQGNLPISTFKSKHV